MSLSPLIARHLRETFYGPNMTGSNLKQHLEDVTWEEAITKIGEFNTIAALTFHIHYYVAAVLKVLEGGPLDAHDKYSYDLPPIKSAGDWTQLVNQLWADVDRFAKLVEALPEGKHWDTFEKEKYGPYLMNLFAIIEHSHYHLGQLVLIKKVIRAGLG